MTHTAQARLSTLRGERHAHCFACGRGVAAGLELACSIDADGRAVAEFCPEPWMASYAGRVHGGLVATLLDSAMTQCLFGHGVTAVTAQLNVRYLRPVTTCEAITVRAWIDEHRHTLYRMRAVIARGNTTLARADAVFVAREDL